MPTLPSEFRLIRLRLARERGHPHGDARHGYDLVAPLDEEGRIMPDLWRRHREACRVRKLRPGEPDEIGRLSRRPGGKWYFDYDSEDEDDDENAFRFEAERFTPGEYAAVREDDGILHTFMVVAVERL